MLPAQEGRPVIQIIASLYFVCFVTCLTFAVHAEEPVGGVAAIKQLTGWLKDHELSDAHLRAAAGEQFASAALTKEEAREAAKVLWDARRSFLRKERAGEVERREIVIGELRMPFWSQRFGEAAEGERSLFISLHGGGGAPAAVNDGQYENQKKLYSPKEGVYLVPRASTNTWDLWHQSHIDEFFDRLIVDMVVLEGVNPDRVYLMGYSAGGDGVYQVAPRTADRWAAASMMAGHPNETKPAGLRNLPFALHVGAEDRGYERNAHAERWKKELADLRAADSEGYEHDVQIHPGLGHWMKLKDAVALPWMAKFTRNVWPQKVVWRQDDVVHSRFYWLEVPAGSAKAGDEVTAEIVERNTIRVTKCSPKRLRFLVDDRILDLDQPIRVELPGGAASEHRVRRTIAGLAGSLLERDDPVGMGAAVIEVEVR
jgi:predicted esterase